MQTSPAVIEAEDLRFRWRPGDADIIAIDRLEVAAGERVFIEGPSGSGKTTLLNLLAAVLPPTGGRLRVLGVDIAAIRPSRRDRFRADHIGVVFQAFNLAPFLSLSENVLLACQFSKRRREHIAGTGRTPAAEAERLLSRLGLDAEALASRNVARLSAGQQQRVAVARALIGGPDIVICDEPTSALDAAARDAFLDLLLAETDAARATLVFVSHDTALAAAFDRSISLPEINRPLAAAP